MLPSKKISNLMSWSALIVLAAIILSALAFRPGEDPNNSLRVPWQQPLASLPDSIPNKNKDQKNSNLDEDKDHNTFNTDELHRAMRRLDREMKKLENQFSYDYWNDLNRELDRAMKEIDINKIQMETEKELRNEDWDKLGDELKNSLGEISVNVNWDDINENLERAKEQISRSRDLIKEEWSRSWKEAMEKSKQATEKAKSELKDLKDFINQLEKDGLLKKNQPYTIEMKHGEFIINGKTQPGSVRDKYRNSDRFGKFFEKDQDWKIQSNGKDDEDDDEDGELI